MTVRLGDKILFELARNDLFDLVLQAEGDFGDFLGVNGRRRGALAADGEDCKLSVPLFT